MKNNKKALVVELDFSSILLVVRGSMFLSGPSSETRPKPANRGRGLQVNECESEDHELAWALKESLKVGWVNKVSKRIMTLR